MIDYGELHRLRSGEGVGWRAAVAGVRGKYGGTLGVGLCIAAWDCVS